jgi:phenylpropionate dioxygenase-like ring-hydroxylating dioxygenase large terminal subunit
MAVKIVKPDLSDEYLVDNRVYTDDQVFRQEQEKIFYRVWNFVCHESEIARPGDYITSHVAGQPIIICRNAQGRINAFYNTCRHRAAQVVRDEHGKANVFTCLYHLWTYDLDGNLVRVPEIEAYKTNYSPEGLKKENFGLVAVRAESIHRMVFVCFDEDAPSLAEYLGDVAERFKNPFGSEDLKVWVVRRQELKANWKMQPENSRDGYHAALLHKRLRHVSPPRPYRIYPHAHTVQLLGLDYEAGLKGQSVDPVLAENPELTRKFMQHPLSGMTKEDSAYVVTIFPDTLVLVRYSTLLMERQIPISPTETVVEIRAGGLVSDSDGVKAIRRKHWELYWSEETGNIPEDWAAWEAQQVGVSSVGVRYSILARGNPGNEGLRGDDNRIRAFWQAWRGYMGAKANAPLD